MISTWNFIVATYKAFYTKCDFISSNKCDI